MKRRILLLLFAVTLISACGDPDASDEALALRTYLARATIVEGELTDALGFYMTQRPVLYDERRAAQASAREMTDAFVWYWQNSLPHIHDAQRGWAQVRPPPPAVEFHATVTSYLEGLGSTFTDGLAAASAEDYRELERVLGRMGRFERLSDEVANGFDALVIQQDRLSNQGSGWFSSVGGLVRLGIILILAITLGGIALQVGLVALVGMLTLIAWPFRAIGRRISK